MRFRAPTGLSSDNFDFLSDTMSTGSPAPPSKAPAPRIRPQPNATAGPSNAKAGPSNVTKTKEKHDIGKDKRKGKAKTPPGMDAGKKERLRAAIKKNKVKETSMGEWSHVYVSNLNSTITHQMLHDAFSRFGTVKRIIVRASGGVPLKNYPGSKPTAWDRQYASVEYCEPVSAKRALSFDGRTLNGVQVAVCYNAADLPETHEAVAQRIAKKKAPPPPKGLNLQIGSALAAFKRLTIDRTHLHIEMPASPQSSSSSQEEKSAGLSAGLVQNAWKDRNLAMDVSFAKTLM